MLALPVCKSWRHQASYSKRSLFCPHEVFQVTKDAPQTILEVTSIAISTWASQTELYQIFWFGQFVFTRHSRLRAKPRAGIIALKVPGSVGTRGYVCSQDWRSTVQPEYCLIDTAAHARTIMSMWRTLISILSNEIHWSHWAKGRKAANTIKAIKELPMNGYIRFLQSATGFYSVRFWWTGLS